jgi:tRNA threonylcarbamoyladenosine dehydratase
MTGHERRFGGVGRLYGKDALKRLLAAHVCVVGLGGVGSWGAEALARSGIGELTLLDLDDVCISNVNRQLHALDGCLGKPKVQVMAERIRAINPECVVHTCQYFFLKSNADEILKTRFGAVLDAIDSPSLKGLLIASCHRLGIPIVTTGGAGGRRDPTAIEVTDLAFTSHDRLLHQVRRQLRQDHGFPRGDKPFGVECVLSREDPVFPTKEGSVCTLRRRALDLRLDCNSGFGTASFVTGAFGLIAASRVVHYILRTPANSNGDEECLEPENNSVNCSS